jgi:hypothetical protein
MNRPLSSSDKPVPRAVHPSFDVKLTSPILSAGTYRVFVERSDLLFIQMEGGGKSILSAVAPLLGPAGNLIPLALWLFSKRTAHIKKERLEQGDPEELLHESEANFKLNLAEIREASIDTKAFFVQSGKAGRLNLTVRHGEKFKFEFENPAQLKQAISLLVPLLNATLTINVEWNEKKGEYEKKKSAPGHQFPA